jgi:hypothetical protein
MNWALKNGWCKDSKEVNRKKARRRHKKGSHRLRWLDFYCTENSARYARLQNCFFNQFAIVVIRRSEYLLC